MSADEPRTLTELSDYIQSLVAFEYVEGGDGYEKSADAMWKAAAAAFNLVAREVRATGFQASWAALKFYAEVMRIECPFMVVRAEDAVYPQYDITGRVSDWLDDNHQWVAEQAAKKLDEYRDDSIVHPDVLAHWKRLVGVAS